ncbi:MAG: hypothetical protein LBE97_00680, partial [Holosporales bacterium]|nr:hypothetical protein [Holosporales bacterium]
PLKELWKNFKFEVVVSITVSACYLGTSYSAMMFGNRLFQQAGYPVSHSMLYSFIDLLWASIALRIAGYIADRIGSQQLLKLGIMLLAVVALPVCYLISGELTLAKIYTYMTIMTFLSSVVLCCAANYATAMFPVKCRYSGYSITDSIGSIIGGFTPFMMLLFADLFHSNLWCVLWIYILTIPTFLLVSIMNKKINSREEEIL